MKAIVAREAGGPGVLQITETARPVPADGEVLVRVQAAGVNRPDVLQRKGQYPPPPGASPLIGLEVAGEVVETGVAVSAWKPGDRVTALANGGGYAQYCAVPATQCLPWPAGYDAIRAAALPETFFTVWANLFGHGRLAAGESVLVHGGSSGIGTTAIQLAREFGATVYATAGSEVKCAACLRLGATAAINYREVDFGVRIAELTDGRGVDVVLDLFYVMRKRLVITGSTMRPRTAAEKGAIATTLRERVWPVLAAGRCGPVVHAVFPLADAARAHALMESGAHIGKIVLWVAD